MCQLGPKKQAREEELTEIIQISKKVARVEKVEFDLTNHSYMLVLFAFCSNCFLLGMERDVFLFLSFILYICFFFVFFFQRGKMSNSERQPAGSV